jgi:NAD(P)-dependent dehydrogenase (short-subunit alcohol dehydrogenase family)
MTENLSGRTCLVTGANTGIGRAAAEGLASRGAHVILACRNPEKAETARREITEKTSNPNVRFVIVDFANQKSIRDFARTLPEDRLHVLVNNAGIWTRKRQESPDGIELTWATNVLGYFLLTSLLLDRLKKAAPARIVNVASDLARDLDLTDVEFKRRPYKGITVYAQSKQANRMWTRALARRLEGSSVTANSMHPGGVKTELVGKSGGLLGSVASVYMNFAGRSWEKGADTVVWLSASPEVHGLTGKFFYDRKERPCRFDNPKEEEKLWALCASMTATQ